MNNDIMMRIANNDFSGELCEEDIVYYYKQGYRFMVSWSRTCLLDSSNMMHV